MPRDELSQSPDDQNAAVAAARAAQEQGDWSEAARLWTAYCDQFADDPSGFVFAAVALQALSRTDEAEEILSAAVQRHPDDGAIRATRARIGERRADWAAAFDRWQTFLDRFPDDPSGYAGVGRALSQLAQMQLNQADEIVRKGVERHPQSGDVLGTYARLASVRRDWAEALARWNVCLERLSIDPISHMGVGGSLRELGRLDEAEAFLRQALEKFPEHAGLNAEFARIPTERRDLREALKRWTAFRERFPDHPEGHNRVRTIVSELGRVAAEDHGLENALLRLAPDRSREDLLLRFELLGDGTEFGVVQWYFGANPLGLLRFTHTPPGLLCAALRAKFQGVGEPENTVLFASRGEWITQDTRYLLAMHTHLRESGSDRDRTFGLICRRLGYLRDKLLTDLTEARKHWVYACQDSAPDDEVRPIWQALRDYGDNRLLFVRPADDAHPPAMLQHIERGLIIGYIDRLSVDNPSYDLWLQMCKEADSIWSADVEFAELIEPVEDADPDI